MLLLIDNFDSFSYILANLIRQTGQELIIKRNEVSLEEIEEIDFKGLILSPGPGTPATSGNLMPILKKYVDQVPILGVCLGHQAIGQHFGGTVQRGGLMHGKTSPVTHDGTGVFADLPSPFIATRYHSLEVVNVPPELIANAHAETPGADHLSVMGFRHESLPIHSVQFHPESIATEHGHALLANFVRLCGLEPVMPARLTA